jgi:Mn-dependent DtxR family transcriptional regulator
MILENNVLESIINNQNNKGISYIEDVQKDLRIDGISLQKILISLKNKGYIILTLSEIEITDLGYSILKNH